MSYTSEYGNYGIYFYLLIYLYIFFQEWRRVEKASSLRCTTVFWEGQSWALLTTPSMQWDSKKYTNISRTNSQKPLVKYHALISRTITPCADALPWSFGQALPLKACTRYLLSKRPCKTWYGMSRNKFVVFNSRLFMLKFSNFGALIREDTVCFIVKYRIPSCKPPDLAG